VIQLFFVQLHVILSFTASTVSLAG